MLMSGLTGKVITWKGVPDGRESYYSPQIHQWSDGTKFVLFGTGGETHGGSLWIIKLDDLIKGDMDKVLIVNLHTSVCTVISIISRVILCLSLIQLLAVSHSIFRIITFHT